MMAGGNLIRQPRQASVRPDIVHERFGGISKKTCRIESEAMGPRPCCFLQATRAPAGAASEPRYLCGPLFFAKSRNAC